MPPSTVDQRDFALMRAGVEQLVSRGAQQDLVVFVVAFDSRRQGSREDWSLKKPKVCGAISKVFFPRDLFFRTNVDLVACGFLSVWKTIDHDQKLVF